MGLRVVANIKTIHKYFGVTIIAAVAGISLFIWGTYKNYAPQYIAQSQPQVLQSTIDCTPDARLVNPCRPWLGAAVGGYGMTATDSNSQFNFFNKRLNDATVLTDPAKAVTLTKKMDMPHVYHPQGSNLFSGSVQTVLGNTAFPQIMVNWKPLPNGYTWSDAAGGNTTVDNYIRTGADNVKALGSRKIILTIWHEPEDDISSGNCTTNAAGASMGSPTDYVNMWHNVRNIFNQQGVSNVVWAMNYMGYTKWDCLVPQLWPGNSYVDWVVFDQYASGTQSFDTSISRFYNVLKNSSNATYDYLSKPWGLAEHGYGNPNGTSTEAGAIDYWSQAKAAIQQNKYPNIKMWLVFDTSVNGESQVGMKFDKTTVQTEEQAAFNGFADAIFAMQASGSSTPPPADTPPTTQPSSGGSSTPISSSNDTAPVIQTSSGQKVVNAQGGGAVKQGGLVTLDPTLVANPEILKSIQKVEFYEGGKLLQTATQEPFAFDTSILGPGSHALRQVTYFKDGSVKEASQTVVVEGEATATLPVTAKHNRVPPYLVVGASLLGLGTGAYFGYRFLSRRQLLPRIPGLSFRKLHGVTVGGIQSTRVIQPTNRHDRNP